MIELQHITKGFTTKLGWHTVLEDVSICFRRGTNIGVIGPNGSGKSTMLKLISREILPTSGTIRCNARVSWPIGFAGGFHGSLTGRENLRFVCRIYNADIAQVTDFVEQFTELGMFMDLPIKTYSTGMRAKLGFGLSMAIDFDCYLIDEVTAVGDAAFQNKCQKEFNARRNRSNLIVVSHNPNTIRRLCDSVAVIYKKNIIYFESIDEGIHFYQEAYAHPIT